MSINGRGLIVKRKKSYPQITQITQMRKETDSQGLSLAMTEAEMCSALFPSVYLCNLRNLWILLRLSVS